MGEPDAKPISEAQLTMMKPLMRLFSRFHARRYLKSAGAKMAQLGGRDICVVTMTGARSGKTRHVPLMYVPYKEGVILVASLAGAPRHPTWYYNLVAHPDIEVQVKGNTLSLRARQASAQEKAEVWPVCVEHYPDYDLYRRRTDRDIPVFICEPRPA
jgi:deazaflavin-dependent oxidoreductase (nitroreductase family)